MIFLRGAVRVMGEPYPRRCCDVLQKQLHMILPQSSKFSSGVQCGWKSLGWTPGCIYYRRLLWKMALLIPVIDDLLHHDLSKIIETHGKS